MVYERVRGWTSGRSLPVQNFAKYPPPRATDMQLIPLELVKSNRDSVRKAREAYLIERGQTLEPHGLNKKDET